MSAKVHLLDGTGNARTAEVTNHSALSVAHVAPDVPPIGTLSRYRYYSALLGSTGADSGTTDMATTADTYYVASHAEYDIRIMHIVLVVTDAGGGHNEWGNIGALTNGCDLIISEAGEDTYLLNKVKTHGQSLVQSGLFGFHTGGSNAFAFILANYSGSIEAQTTSIPVREFVPGGLRIGRGTHDELRFVANDDLSNLEGMDCRVIGYRHYP